MERASASVRQLVGFMTAVVNHAPTDILDLPYIPGIPLYFRTCRITTVAIREE
jgi:hypothetical protein